MIPFVASGIILLLTVINSRSVRLGAETQNIFTFAKVSALARLVFYFATCVSVPALRRRLGDQPSAYRLPGGSAIPVLAAAGSLAIILSADTVSLLAGAAALVIGAALYALYGSRASSGR